MKHIPASDDDEQVPVHALVEGLSSAFNGDELFLSFVAS